MIKNLPRLSAIALSAALVLTALAGSFDKFALKRVPTVGEVSRFNVVGTLTIQGKTLSLAGKATETVKKVDADTYVIEETQTDTHVTIDGNEMAQPETTVTQTSKLTGEIVSIQAPQSSSEGLRLSTLSQFYFPTKPVDVGDTWTYTAAAVPNKGTLAFKVDYKILGEEKVGTVDTEKIDVNGTETEGDTPFSMKGTYWINKATGALVKVESTVKNLPLGPGATADGTISQKPIG